MISALKKYRVNANLTQYELGEEVGKTKVRGASKVTKGWISQIENGETNCPDWLAEAIAEVLRCNMDTLFKKEVERKTRYMIRKVSE